MLEGSLIHQHSTETRITPDSPTRPEGRLRKEGDRCRQSPEEV